MRPLAQLEGGHQPRRCPRAGAGRPRTWRAARCAGRICVGGAVVLEGAGDHRVATPKLEESLVELARHATASQLEQIVREYRKADPDEAEKAQSRHETRYLRSSTEDDGMVVVDARLSPEDGAVVLAAIGAARAALAETRRHEPAETSGQLAGVPAETSEPVAGVPAETSVTPAGVPTETSEHPATDDPWSKAGARRELRLEESLQPAETAAADALVAMCASVLSGGLGGEMEDPHVSVIVHVDEKVLVEPSATGCAHIDGLGAITGHAARRLACDGAVSRILFSSAGTVEQRARRGRSRRRCAVPFSPAIGAAASRAAPPGDTCTPIMSCSGRTAARRR